MACGFSLALLVVLKVPRPALRRAKSPKTLCFCSCPPQVTCVASTSQHSGCDASEQGTCRQVWKKSSMQSHLLALNHQRSPTSASVTPGARLLRTCQQIALTSRQLCKLGWLLGIYIEQPTQSDSLVSVGQSIQNQSRIKL